MTFVAERQTIWSMLVSKLDKTVQAMHSPRR
jgi:hypothetical protein